MLTGATELLQSVVIQLLVSFHSNKSELEEVVEVSVKLLGLELSVINLNK